jgi:hypothetical protein
MYAPSSSLLGFLLWKKALFVPRSSGAAKNFQHLMLEPKTAISFLRSCQPTLVALLLLEVPPFSTRVEHYRNDIHWSLIQLAVIVIQLLQPQIDTRCEVVLGCQPIAIRILAGLRDQILDSQPLGVTEQFLEGRKRLADGTEFATSRFLQ